MREVGRAIAKACGVSPSTIAACLGRIALAKPTWPLPPELDDDVAFERLFPHERKALSNRTEPDWTYGYRRRLV